MFHTHSIPADNAGGGSRQEQSKHPRSACRSVQKRAARWNTST
uniref:Uncharacterized protein n=1 Tax=Arundo donax TaxID=35708 RepID=A0A0A9BDN0_ARUDO